MNLKILLLALSATVFCSCSSTYRNGQTPDDVYYSPVRSVTEEDQTKVEEEKTVSSPEDRQIHMSRYDRRWNDIDNDYDYGCHYDPYHYGYNYGYYYNPYYCSSPVFTPCIRIINPKNSTPRMTNLGSYYSSTVKVVDPKTGTSQSIRTGRQYNNSNSSSSTRRVLHPSNTNSSSDNNTRTYTPSTNSTNSSSSGSGGTKSSGTPVTRPGRG